jgi:acyl-CoA synthetase (AMP-forming)/AMP-acid ligase II
MSAAWQSPVVHNVAGALSAQARERPEQAAMHYPAGTRRGRVVYRSCSYRELDELSDAWARGLQHLGIGRGVRTALMVPPGLDFFALFFGLFKAGAVPVLIDPGIGLKSLKTCLGEAAPEAFIGVSRAQLARTLLRWAPQSIHKTVTLGPRPGWYGHSAREVLKLGRKASGSVLEATRPEDTAAILFTSGSTGTPKGVVYRHRHFTAQVDMLRTAFDIRPGDVNLPTFPPFALFDPALGMTSVIPHMDPTRPARANPQWLVQAIEQFGVTTVFGSPALLRVLAEHTGRQQLRLESVKCVISAGASVPIDVIRQLEQALPAGTPVHTPYGATECLPVSSIASTRITPRIEQATASGAGICVGRPVPPNRVGIIAIDDGPEPLLDQDRLLAPGETGEIVVNGPTVTDSYWHRERQTQLAKTTDLDGQVWHRMGDVGYLDASGMLWYCGRKSQRVILGQETLFTDQLEAVFNNHGQVRRTALVGIRRHGATEAVLCVELSERQGSSARERIAGELLDIARANPRTRNVGRILFHPGFPVDIRHNAKIGRERLAAWAQRQLS